MVSIQKECVLTKGGDDGSMRTEKGHVRIQREASQSFSSQSLPGTSPAGTLILDFRPLEPRGEKKEGQFAVLPT